MSAAASSPVLGIRTPDDAPRKPDVEARVPEFADLGAPSTKGAATGSLDNLLDVTCTVTAELGRRKLSIGEVLKLNVGAILELDRAVSEPVDVMVQGVLLARGEVVVVDDRFAIRVKEIIDAKRRDAAAPR